MKNIAKWVRHNQGVTFSILLIIIVTAWTFGCESRVASLLNPTKMVNSEELKVELDSEVARLQLEIERMLATADLRLAHLARLEAVKQKLFEFAAITADAKTVNPAGVVGLLFSILGIGAVIDNRIKDKVIKNRPKYATADREDLKKAAEIVSTLTNGKV